MWSIGLKKIWYRPSFHSLHGVSVRELVTQYTFLVRFKITKKPLQWQNDHIRLTRSNIHTHHSTRPSIKTSNTVLSATSTVRINHSSTSFLPISMGIRDRYRFDLMFLSYVNNFSDSPLCLVCSCHHTRRTHDMSTVDLFYCRNNGNMFWVPRSFTNVHVSTLHVRRITENERAFLHTGLAQFFSWHSVPSFRLDCTSTNIVCVWICCSNVWDLLWTVFVRS